MVLEENGEGKMVKISNEQVLERIGEKMTILNNILISPQVAMSGVLVISNRKAAFFCVILKPALDMP